MKVFLGGTCNGSKWRDGFIASLKEKRIDYYNPVVEVWDENAKAEETFQKNTVCDVHLYVITPKMKGVFSIAEAVESSHLNDKNTIFCILTIDEDKRFAGHEYDSLQETAKIIEKNHGVVCYSLEEVIDRLSKWKQSEIEANKHTLLKFNIIGSSNEDVQYLYDTDIKSISSISDTKGKSHLLVTYFDDEFQIVSTLVCDSVITQIISE